MKKSLITIMLLTLLMVFSSNVYGESDIAIQLDQETMAFTEETGFPFVDENERTLVPFRHVLEAYGAEVSWDAQTRMATALLGGRRIEVPIDACFIYNNGDQVTIDTAARIINGRTYLPLRAVVEAFGGSVTWYSASRTIAIDRPFSTSANTTIAPSLVADVLPTADLALGATKEDLIQQFGQPTDVLPSSYGFDWLIYADDYDNYIQVGLNNNKVCAIQSATSVDGLRYDLIGLSASTINERYGSPLRGVNHSGTLYLESCNYQTVHSFDGGYLWVTYDALDTKTVSSYFIIDSQCEEDMLAVRSASTSLEEALATQLFHWTNVMRVKEGLQTLTQHSKGEDMAFSHARDMALRDYFSHVTPEGATLGDRIDCYDVSCSSAGENLASNQVNSLMAIEALMHSPGHRVNILNPDYESLGTGVGIGDPFKTYYAQNFFSNQ